MLTAPLNLNEAFGTIQSPLISPFPPHTLSLNLIVKNEVGNIKQAIESARGIANEIIVNDTGSTDGTQAILEALGVTWFQTTWKKNFSEARNQCIRKSTSAWILWIDADDRLSEETCLLIQKLKKEPLNSIHGFEVINTQDQTNNGPRFLQIRLFPNNPSLQFERSIHEQIDTSAANLGLHCRYHSTAIFHRGYESPQLKKEKAHRNLPLILADTKRLHTNPSFAMSLGDAYYILEEWEKGIHAYQQVLNIPDAKTINQEVYEDIPTYIGFGFSQLKKWEKAEEWLNHALEPQPKKSEPYFYLAKVFSQTNRSVQAIQLYHSILSMKQPITGTLNRYHSIRLNSLLQLIKLHYKSRSYPQSICFCKQLISEQPKLVEPYYWLGLNHKKQLKPKEAVTAWTNGLELNPTLMIEIHRELLNLLKEMGQSELYQHCLKLAQLHFTEFNQA